MGTNTTSCGDAPRRAGELPINLLIFSITRYRRDFRKYLIRAAQRSAAKVRHACFRNEIIFSWADAERIEFSGHSNSCELEQMIRSACNLG